MQSLLSVAFALLVVSHAAETMMVPDLDAGDGDLGDRMGMLVSELEIGESKPVDHSEAAFDMMEKKEEEHQAAVAAGRASGPYTGDIDDGPSSATGGAKPRGTGATGTVGSTGATGATGATGKEGSDDTTTKPLDTPLTVTFKGKKGKQLVCYNCRENPKGMPEHYHERVSMRKARDVVKSVLSDFPDKIRDFHLSSDARCVSSDPYYPEYYDPIGLDNPTEERQTVRDFADATKGFKNMSSINTGGKALDNYLITSGDKGIDMQAEELKIVRSKKDHVAVDMVKQIAHKVQAMAMSKSFEETDKGIGNIKNELKAADAKQESQR